MDFGPEPDGRARDSGIYEFDGETLKMAFGDPGGPRPAEFRPGEGDKAPHLLILKRKNPAVRPGGPNP